MKMFEKQGQQNQYNNNMLFGLINNFSVEILERKIPENYVNCVLCDSGPVDWIAFMRIFLINLV